jgi:hypothetical protein
MHQGWESSFRKDNGPCEEHFASSQCTGWIEGIQYCQAPLAPQPPSGGSPSSRVKQDLDPATDCQKCKKYNIYEQCDRFNTSTFSQSPNIPLDVVRGYVSSSTSKHYERNLRRQEKIKELELTDDPFTTKSDVNHTIVIVGTQSSTVAMTPLFVPSPECTHGQVNSYINDLYPSPLQKQPCTGMNNE